MADAMVIVVTGGNSFLARHLIPYLASKKTIVFATYRTPDERLEALQRVPGVHLVQLNIAEYEEGYRQLPQEADALVHVAAASTARPGGIDDFITCNVIGARNVARYARAARIKKVIYTSSISVYGDIHEPYLEETHPITNPDDYGLTKYLAERVFAETEVSCVALRLPGILGKGAHRAWIPTLVHRVLEGDRKATIYGPSSLFNNAAHVREISEFVWLLLNSPMSGFNAVNLAAADPITIREVIVLMAEILGETIEMIERPAPKPSFTISSERAQRLGYTLLPIKQMLRRYFEESHLTRVKAPDKVR
jgi:nucleoside-diphosphate-sugar epimerase